MEVILHYTYAVFKSRSETLSFSNYLKKLGVPCAITSTPKQAGRTCGISVRFSTDYLAIVKSYFPQRGYSSFVGFLPGE